MSSDGHRRAPSSERGQPSDIRFQDFRTFSAIVRCGSVRGAARQLGTTPSYVSKALARLEHQWQRKLLVRGDRGITVSAAVRRTALRMDAILAEIEALAADVSTRERSVTIAGTTFLNQCLLAPLAGRLDNIRIRSIELPPGLAAAYASADLFSIAIVSSAESWPRSWHRLLVGRLRYGVFASPRGARALGRPPITPRRLHGRAFIGPIYAFNGQVVQGDDACPLGARHRTIGHETQTLALALDMAARTDELVFAPQIAARPLLASRALVEVPVKGWTVLRPLWLVCHGERVLGSVRRTIVASIRESLKE